jgi:D-alanyl-D-alanine carboxypeptidase
MHRSATCGRTTVIRFLEQLRFTLRLRRLHRRLGIPADYARMRSLPRHAEARRLASVGPDIYDRDQRLIPPAADAWRSMAAAAAGDGIELQLVSAFRSVGYQEGLVRRKLERGQSIAEILRVSAAPGYSEHHTGRAVDVTTPGFAVLEDEFENSAAFAWLTRRAAEFGFTMSYPRDNPHGVAYEPWHWAWWGDR